MNYTENINLRLDKETKEAFYSKAEKLEVSAPVLMRELIKGYIEDRVTIELPESLKEIYNIEE